MFPRKEKITIIAELSPQNEGDMSLLETMIMQAKVAGADMIKLQLYDSVKLLGDTRKKFAEITNQELIRIVRYADLIKIPIFASVFDEERLSWVNNIESINTNKIASKVHLKDDRLCRQILDNGDVTFISNGLDQNNFKYASYGNAKYLYCVANYPTYLDDICLPNFNSHKTYVGISDHSYGLTVVKAAVVRGAKYIEKHFTLSKGMQSSINKAHYGSMVFEELRELRTFCDDFVRIILDD